MRDTRDGSADEASDDALMAAYAAGQPEAARLLIARHAPRAMALATRLLGDRAEAEDVAQEALLRLWRVAPEWQAGRAQVSTWLYRVVRNLCTDRLRRRRGPGAGVDLDSIAEPASPRPGVVAQMIAADRAGALQAALDRLPERQREAVVLRHLEGLANPEIAEILGVSIEAVESLTARARRNLVQMLAPERETLGLDP